MANSYHLNLNVEQSAMLKARAAREFYVMCVEARVKADIEAASTLQELSKIAKKRGLCDYSDLDLLDLDAAKMLLRVISRVMYRYPRLRARACFIGSKHGYLKAMRAMCEGDKDVIKGFNLHYICDDSTARQVGRCGIELVEDGTKHDSDDNNILATYVYFGGLIDAVLLDEKDFTASAFRKLKQLVIDAERDGQHPRGCTAPESIMFHEFGHLLDHMVGASEDERIINRFNTAGSDVIKRELSSYATVSVHEYVAEGFSESMVNAMPRNEANFITDILNSRYRRLKNS